MIGTNFGDGYLIYVVFAGTIVLLNFLVGFYNSAVSFAWIPNFLPKIAVSSIVDLLKKQEAIFYFMAGLSLTNAFLIVPERSVILSDYQVHFSVLAGLWLIVPLVLMFIS